ncbi:hypothetical protein P3S67_000386 [Capsicum chacoense]
MKSSYFMMNLFISVPTCQGWSTKGKFAFPCFHKDTHSISLRNKLCYMGHRRFLPMNHPWSRNRVLFDGKVEMGAASIPVIGVETLV